MEILKRKPRAKASKLNGKTRNRKFDEQLWHKLASLQRSVGRKANSVKLVQADRS